MLTLCAFLAGFGGLLLELVLVRRHGLLLGNTSEAAATVLATFLLGLGAGGLLAPHLPLGRRAPLCCAALLYGAVAVAAVSLGEFLAGLEALPWWGGTLAVVLAPGLPAGLMGAAFPLLLAGLPRAAPFAPARAVAANLVGSVLACAVGGNVLIPELGLRPSLALGGAAYALVALVLAAGARGAATLRPPPIRTPLPAAVRGAAFASGMLVLGAEVLALRRLPFFVEGFQPTLAGVVSVALACLAVGAALARPLALVLRRLPGPAPEVLATVAGAVLLNVGLLEHAAPLAARLRPGSELTMHLRIALVAAIAIGPALVALGAVVPLALARFLHPETRAQLAGELFFWQGLGGLAGALWVGRLVPMVFPQELFVLAAPLLALAALAVVALAVRRERGARRVTWAAAAAVLVAVAGGTGAGTPWSPAPPIAGSRWDRGAEYRPLAHRSDSVTTASVVYGRKEHSLLLFTDEFRAAETGPATGYMRVLGHLPFVLQPRLARAAVIALGTGTTANAVAAWPGVRQLDLVELSPAVLALTDRFTGGLPLAPPAPPPFAQRGAHVHVTDGRRFLARAEPGTFDLVTMEPLLPYQPGTVPLYTREFYALAARALAPGGLLLQWVPAAAMPEAFFATLLATFARSFTGVGVFLVDNSTLLVGANEALPLAPEAWAAAIAAAPATARLELHAAGLPQAVDLTAGFVGDRVREVLVEAEDLHDDRPFLERIGHWSGATILEFLPANLAVLERIAAASGDGPGGARAQRARLGRLAGRLEQARARGLVHGEVTAARVALAQAVRAFERARAELPDATLLHREQTIALRELLELEVQLADPEEVAHLVAGHLRRDPRSALLLAAQGVPDQGGRRALPAGTAAAQAVAVDPTFFRHAPAVVAGLAPPVPAVGPLEDLAALPAGGALLAAASTSDARAVALRAHYPVPVAQAAVAVLAARPLAAAERQALLVTLDPCSLEQAAAAVLARGGSLAAEVLDLWRPDLPMPASLRTLAGAGATERARLAAALGGRRAAPERDLLAGLLDDADPGVRTAAGVALFETAGKAIDYDPQWEPARRLAAARRLRDLK